MATEVLDLLWIAFFVSLSLFAYFLSKSLYGDPVSPLSVYVGVNGISISSYHLKLVRFVEVSFEVHVILLVSILVFFVAAYMNDNRLSSKYRMRIIFFNGATGLAIFFYFIASLSTIGWITALVILAKNHGLVYLFHNLWILQLQFQMRFIGYLNLMGILVLPMFIIKRSLGEKRAIDIFVVIASLFGLLLAGIKTYLICSIISATFVYMLFGYGNLRIIRLLFVAGIIIAFFSVYNNTIDLFVTRTYEGSLLPEWLSFLEGPYIYFVGSWPAMGFIVSGTMPPAPIFGYVTLEPLWKVLGHGMHVMGPLPHSLPHVCIGATTFNVFSFVGEVYWDYGLAGVVAFSFLLGCLSTRLYLIAKEDCFWGYKLLYSLVMYTVFMSFFMYTYRFTFMFLLMFVYLLVCVPVRLRNYYGWHGKAS